MKKIDGDVIDLINKEIRERKFKAIKYILMITNDTDAEELLNKYSLFELRTMAEFLANGFTPEQSINLAKIGIGVKEFNDILKKFKK